MHSVNGQSPPRAWRHRRGRVNCVCLDCMRPSCVRQWLSSCSAWLYRGSTLVMDYSNSMFWLRSVCGFVLCTYCRGYQPYHRSLCFDMLFILSYLNLKIILAQSLTNAPRCVQMHPLIPHTPFKCSPFQTGLASAFPAHLISSSDDCLDMGNVRFSLSLCRRCYASSNICEVLSSSLQLRRAVSVESRLLTRNTVETA